jgi:hypothetical protein
MDAGDNRQKLMAAAFRAVLEEPGYSKTVIPRPEPRNLVADGRPTASPATIPALKSSKEILRRCGWIRI